MKRMADADKLITNLQLFPPSCLPRSAVDQTRAIDFLLAL